jgi:hypothetical protein
MGEDDGVDSFAATDATPIERRDFQDRLRDHQPSAAMALVGLLLLPPRRPL